MSKFLKVSDGWKVYAECYTTYLFLGFLNHKTISYMGKIQYNDLAGYVFYRNLGYSIYTGKILREIADFIDKLNKDIPNKERRKK